jgi:translation initiation factor 4E
MESYLDLDEKFSFYYRISDNSLLGNVGNLQYENTVKKIADFETVEDFWKIFQHMKKPEHLKNGIEFQLFKHNIKPLWEDESNKKGGRISIKLKKENSSLVWEEFILLLIGGNFPDKIKEEINGVLISIRRDFNFLQIWFKTFENNNINDINQCLRELLQIPNEVELDVKPFANNKNEGGYYKKNYNNYYKGGRYYK